MEKDTLTVLVVEPDKKPYVKNISSELKSLQHEVGGYIQAVYPWEDSCAIICNDEGKLMGLKPNRALRDENGEIYDIIAGTFVVAGLGDENFISLDCSQIQRFTDMFLNPEAFVKIGDRLIAFPI